MKSKLLIVAFILFSLCSFSQQLTYKKGRVYDDNDKKLSNTEVKNLLASQPKLLQEYKAGNTKAGVGGFLLGFGGGLIIADLISGGTQDVVYPTALTYVGLASAIISIPVLIGHSKKTKSAIDGYNESLATKKVGFTFEKINIINNSTGIGMQITF